MLKINLNKERNGKSKMMKKILQGAVLVFGAVLTLPLLFGVGLYAFRFAAFYVALSQSDTGSCSHYYEGVSKGLAWERGEWHHYVDFQVRDADAAYQFQITESPLPASFWEKYSTPSLKRVTYRWPSNWIDPFPANDWKICLVASS